MARRVPLPGGSIDLRTGVGTVDDRSVRLSARERTLLEMLAERDGQPVSREALERALGLPDDADRGVLDAAVYRLRRKIERDPKQPAVLLSAHGEGYRLAEAAPESSGPSRPGSLRRSLIGRAAEQSRLAGTEAGLRTLVGPPGVGKTSLARWLVDQAPADGLVVELAPASDAVAVWTAVAGALGLSSLRGGTEDALADQVVEAVAETEPALLVLDNAEHVLDAVRALVSTLRERVLSVPLVVTSRVPLGLDDEVVVRLAPLSPDDAVALFRARADDAGVLLEDDDPAVPALVDALDRLPLALELAAARTRILSPAQIGERLSQRFRLLRGGDRSTEDRHRALSTALAWSWDLLSPERQRALARASVFVDRLRPEPAEAVLGGDADTHLDALVEASLVVPTDDGWRLLQSVRDFAGRALDERGERHDAELAHAEVFVALARAAQRPGRARDPVVIDALDVLLPELLATVRVVDTHPELVGEAALLLFDRYQVRGPVPQLLVLIDPAVSGVGDDGSIRAELLWARAVCLRDLGRLDEALACNEAALAAGPDPQHRVGILGEQAALLSILGRHDEAVDAVDTLLQQMQDVPLRDRATYRGNAAVILQRAQVPPEELLELVSAALSDAEAAEATFEAAATRAKRGSVLMECGRLDEASEALTRALSELEALGAEQRTGSVLHDLAVLEALRDDPDAAERLLDRAEAVFEEHGRAALRPYVDLFRAQLHLDRGAFDAALVLLGRPEVAALPGAGVARVVALAHTGRLDEAGAGLQALSVDEVDPTLQTLAAAHVAVGRGDAGAPEVEAAVGLSDLRGPAVLLQRTLVRALRG